MKETPLISEDLLRLLICPIDGCELVLVSDFELKCVKSSSVYVIDDGVPVMIVHDS